MDATALRLAAPAVGEVIGGKYRIDRIVGRGGMGTVYAATHVVTGKAVAIKWLLAEETVDPHADERFLREAQAAGRVRHPNVVDVYDVG
ncbi:MAG: protein kinase, partial [Polyangiaceae bacterium]|nr:protein kinase [Polyangiaceae bacterium]